ncbi:MAG: hypothetical protein UT43_C0046G0004 [Parcubacteria group bacterium GW2011_GWC1_39_29]|nr:MAG: hypothetical protein UT43_C0046G0004 [Parcubacteria group bacterium GW2011_GWC1_39_29]HBT80745.1 hypothetical protein [Candidatus Yanofskybacteria bacterium]
MIELIVKRARKEDIYNDIIRVSKLERKDKNDHDIKEGSLCKVWVLETGRWVYAILRGNEQYKNKETVILIDEYLRERLGIEKNNKYAFTFQRVWFLDWLQWAWSATNPGYRISMRIAIASVVLSVLGILTTFVPKLSLDIRQHYLHWPHNIRIHTSDYQKH